MSSIKGRPWWRPPGPPGMALQAEARLEADTPAEALGELTALLQAGHAVGGHLGGGPVEGGHVGGGSVIPAVLVGSGILPNSLINPAVGTGYSAGFDAGADYEAFVVSDYDAFVAADYDAFGGADYDFGGMGFDGAATTYDAGDGHGAGHLHEIGIAEGVTFDAFLDGAAAFQDGQDGGFEAAGFANGGQISGSYGI
ncbi:fibroin heavy chain-like [Penaeus chinensis]|uniref:fibroin heavy chain-like n=1 Tax=Penaeus chinensis TaxID=139456 RepID=UPI001FB56ED1|nr:fibroin heavy chain-like [Penaeus chinensis]